MKQKLPSLEVAKRHKGNYLKDKTNIFEGLNPVVVTKCNPSPTQYPHDSTPMQYFMYGYGMALVTVFVAV